MFFEQRVREYRPDDPRKAARSLRDADRRALFVGGRQNRDHAEYRRSCKAGADRQKRQNAQQARPVADEWHRSHCGGNEDKAQRDQEWLAQLLDGAANGAALNEGAHDPAIGVEIDDLGVVNRKTVYTPHLQMEILADQQTERRFETRKAERRKKENADQEADLWQAQCVDPLVEAGPPRRVFRRRFPALGQARQREEKI